MATSEETIEAVANCLVRAGSCLRADKKRAYERAIATEKDATAKWLLQTLLLNGELAEKNQSPLCDDTGIPHALLEFGGTRTLDSGLISDIHTGIARGLALLPGRPMAVKGDDQARLGQTLGMFDDPAAVEMAPLAIRQVPEDVLRLHVLMFGGGPAIRGRSFRVFHKHDAAIVEAEIVTWAIEACKQLGCTPSTLAIGIGRSHYEAANLMLQAQVDGSHDVQSELEQRITNAVNESGVGAMGIGGRATVLGTFVAVGPARASGVRIVCMRPCCCVEPRLASVDL